MAIPEVQFTSEGPVAFLTFNRPDARNAMTFPMYDALADGTVDAQENPLVMVEGNRLFEVQTHLSLTAHMWSGFNLLAHLQACGVESHTGIVDTFGRRGKARSVYFRDPDGSLLEFITYPEGDNDQPPVTPDAARASLPWQPPPSGFLGNHRAWNSIASSSARSRTFSTAAATAGSCWRPWKAAPAACWRRR